MDVLSLLLIIVIVHLSVEVKMRFFYSTTSLVAQLVAVMVKDENVSVKCAVCV